MGAQVCSPTNPGNSKDTEALSTTKDGKGPLDKDLEAVELQKEITKEAFQKGLLKLLNLAIDGYPKAVRSTIAKRNEELRLVDGDAEKAEVHVKAQAAAIKEEAKTWFLGLVPYIGLPATLLWPTWTLLRRVCVMCALYGHDVSEEETRAKIIIVFGNLRAVPAAEHVLENAIQLVWVCFAGPVAHILPVGSIVSKVANAEGHIMGILAKETFSQGQITVPKETYEETLDSEPTWKDYQELAKEGAQYAYVQAWAKGEEVYTMAWDEEQRKELLKNAQAHLKHGRKVARGAIKGAPGAAAAAGEQAQAVAGAAVAKGQEMLDTVLKGSTPKSAKK